VSRFCDRSAWLRRGPADAAAEKIEEEIVLPIFRALAPWPEVDAALAFIRASNDRNRTTLIASFLSMLVSTVAITCDGRQNP